MNNIIKIYLWDKEVAAMAWDLNRDTAVIEFYDSFVSENLDISPITMPLKDIKRGEKIFSFPGLSKRTFQGLPGLIADSLPDDYGNSIIDEWFSRKGITIQITALERLLYMGKRAMGALEYEPAIKEQILNESTTIEINEMVEMAESILNERAHFQTRLSDNTEALINILKVGTSAGGAKPKAIITYNSMTNEVRSGQVKAPHGFEYWLLKFDGVEGGKIRDNPAGIGKIEYTYYQMAVDSGIIMTESKLWNEKDRSHFMTKRFDRDNNGEKYHVQTLCGLAHFDRDHRHSYEQIFQIMRQMHLSYVDMEQMYRRMIFNVMSRNHDDHTKNHAFLMDKNGIWTLAPAYDLCYTYSPSGTWTQQHQLSLNGKRENFIYDDLIIAAQKADIRNPKEIIEQISSIVSQFKNYAKDVEVQNDYIELIESNLILF